MPLSSYLYYAGSLFPEDSEYFQISREWDTSPSLRKSSNRVASRIAWFLFGCAVIARKVRFVSAGYSFLYSPVCYKYRGTLPRNHEDVGVGFTGRFFWCFDWWLCTLFYKYYRSGMGKPNVTIASPWLPMYNIYINNNYNINNRIRFKCGSPLRTRTSQSTDRVEAIFLRTEASCRPASLGRREVSTSSPRSLLALNTGITDINQ